MMVQPDVKKSTEGTSTGSGATPAPAGSAAERSTAAATDAVLSELGGEVKKKKKRKYSRGLKEVQIAERGVSKAGRRVARAMADGFSTYYDRDRKSSRKKRDGAIRDAVKNWAKGLGKAARKSSNAPYDVAKAFDTKTVRRNVRNVVRFLAPPFFR
jgi:hypothetical protein